MSRVELRVAPGQKKRFLHDVLGHVLGPDPVLDESAELAFDAGDGATNAPC